VRTSLSTEKSASMLVASSPKDLREITLTPALAPPDIDTHWCVLQGSPRVSDDPPTKASAPCRVVE